MDKKCIRLQKLSFEKISNLYPFFCEFTFGGGIFKLRHSILFYIKWLTQTKSGKTQQHYWDASSRLQLFLMLQNRVDSTLEFLIFNLHDFWLEKSTWTFGIFEPRTSKTQQQLVTTKALKDLKNTFRL